MSNTIRIKRRAAGGASGAPSSLENAELAFNEQDDILYYGKGAGGAGGSATVIIPIGGPDAFQPIDSDLTAIAGLSTTGLIVRTGSGTAAARTLTGPAAGITITNGDGVSGNPTIALANDLAALEGLATTGLIIRTGDGTATTRAITGTSTRIIVTNGDGVSGAPTIDLASLTIGGSGIGTYTKLTVDTYGRVTSTATASISDLSVPTGNISWNNQKITNLGTPSDPLDAANKAYVDAARVGMDVKESVRLASTGNITLTYTATGGTSARGQITAAPNSLDGVNLAQYDRILLKDQSTGAQNGIYVVSTLGTGSNGVWDRAEDADSDAEVTAGLFVFVTEGTVNSDSGWVLTTNDVIVVGGNSGTALTFAQFSGAGQITAGAGLTKTGNTLDVVTANSGRIVVNADSIDLASGIIGTPGTYKSVTVDTYGRITGGSNPTTLSGYGITDAQPLDPTLTALAGVTTATDALIYATAADTFTTTTLSSFGRSLIDDADNSAARTTLGLGSISTQAASNVAITGGSITNLTTFDGITIDGGTF